MDTSFLLYMLREHTEFDEKIRQAVPGPIKIATIDLVRFELERLARIRASTSGGLSKLALDQLDRKNVRVIGTLTGTGADMAIIAAALSERGPVTVATVDRSLRENLAKVGISTLYPRSHRGLIFLRARSSSA